VISCCFLLCCFRPYCLRQGGYVMPGVCLYVCRSVFLLATLHKLTSTFTKRIFVKILSQEDWIFWKSSPRPDPDAGIFCRTLQPVALPGFVVRRGKARNYVMGHSRWTLGPGAEADRWLIVLWLMQYWSNVSCWYLHQLISHTTQYLAISFKLYSKVNWKWNCCKSGGYVPQCPVAGDATAFNIAIWGICTQFGSYLWKNWSHLHENFTIDVKAKQSKAKEVLDKFAGRSLCPLQITKNIIYTKCIISVKFIY